MVNCIFCDLPLTRAARTKEHVLPMWLLKATGDPNREIRIGADLLTGKEWKRPASTFEFPACHKCNQRYGKGLESQAHKIILAIQAGKSISIANGYRLLDWLDKVRVGLWRGFQMLHHERDFTPRFTINTRLARKDRVAILAVDPKDKTKRLNFGGTDNNLFRLSQCGIFLRINNIRILSLSADFLLTRETGLPHGDNPFLVEGKPGMVGNDLVIGNYALSQDWGNLSALRGTILAQPIIDIRLHNPATALNLYTNSRVMTHSKDSFRANGIEQFLRIIPLQLITNSKGKFRYHANKRERIKVGAAGEDDDAAFMRVLYALMLQRGLRNFPLQIRLASGKRVDWYKGWQTSMDCMFQLRSRLEALGIILPDTAILVDEIQRMDRILEESYAQAEGTLVAEAPLIG